MPTVYVRGSPIRLSDKDQRGFGSEADVYEIPSTINLPYSFPVGLKLYKQPNHPDFQGKPETQKFVREKLEVLQTKLREFPKNLPDKMIVPLDLATNSSGARIDGYLMHFLRGATTYWEYSQIDFRERGGIGHNTVVGLHRKLHSIITGGHAANLVFADLNSLNILVLGDEVYYVDTDSGQWGKYISTLYTLNYVDPILCVWDPMSKVPELAKPHNKNSDWYAYTVMLMENMLFSGPYDGNYRPKKKDPTFHDNMRSLKRINVWNPEVIYLKYALPLKVLPDDLHSYFKEVFVSDKRGAFPVSLLDNLRWTTCTKCGQIHARGVCPTCAMASPSAVKEKTVIRGNVTATRIFPTSRESGTILHASTQNGVFRYLYHTGSELKRENGSVVSRAKLDPNVRYRVQNNKTLFAKNGFLVVYDPNGGTETIPVGSYGTLPMFDANSTHIYWIANGSLYFEGHKGPEFVGNVLENQTLFWVGSHFGFGFWRAGEITTGFVFDVGGHAINDSVNLPPINGQLLNSTVTFTKDRAWFFSTIQYGGKILNRCAVIKSDGTLEATAEAQKGDGSWLSEINGKCAIGGFLLSATDDGIVRVEPNGGSISVTREFPDAEQFVHSGSLLYAHSDGLVALTGREIYILKIN